MPLRDDLLTPISGENPSGSNLRYDPVTDAIKEARREDLDVSQGAWKTALKTADYPQVVKLAGDALANRGKDLQIAVWLVDAQVRREGFAALAPSFEFLHRLLDQFWDTLYPEIEDGDLELRAAPLDWLGNKLETPVRLLPITTSGLTYSQYDQSRKIGYEQDAVTGEKQAARQQAIKEGKPTAELFDEAVNTTPRAFYEACQNSLTLALEKLQILTGFCDDRFGDFSPSFLKTRAAIEEIAKQTRIFLGKKAPAPASAVPAAPAKTNPEPVAVPVAAPPVEAVAPPAVAPPVAAAPAPAPRPSGASPVPSGLSDVIARIGVICRYLRESTIYDASAFLVIRSLRWGELRAKAPEIEPTMLQAPTPELRAAIKERFAAKDWEAVLTLTEDAMELPCGRAWLDLQRYTIQALEQKGEYYERVAGSIRTALRALLEEIPELLEQSLTDDTPVANAETRTWINEHVLAGTAPPVVVAAEVPVAVEAVSLPAPVVVLAPLPLLEAKPPQLEPDEEQTPSDLFVKALEAATTNRSADAIELISRQLASERSGRGRFRRRTQLAHLLMMGGHKQIALPILERLVAEMEQRKLEDWEQGEALAYPVDLLIRCLDANGSDPAERRQLYSRLCQLDPTRALNSNFG